jgi:hypothetical protein
MEPLHRPRSHSNDNELDPLAWLISREHYSAMLMGFNILGEDQGVCDIVNFGI